MHKKIAHSLSKKANNNNGVIKNKQTCKTIIF